MCKIFCCFDFWLWIVLFFSVFWFFFSFCRFFFLYSFFKVKLLWCLWGLWWIKVWEIKYIVEIFGFESFVIIFDYVFFSMKWLLFWGRVSCCCDRCWCFVVRVWIFECWWIVVIFMWRVCFLFDSCSGVFCFVVFVFDG